MQAVAVVAGNRGASVGVDHGDVVHPRGKQIVDQQRLKAKIAGIALFPHQHFFVLAVVASVLSQAGENGQIGGADDFLD